MPNSEPQVLVVAADDDLHSPIAERLRGAGYAVLRARSAPETVRLWQRLSAPALVLLDGELPGLELRPLLAHLRALRPADHGRLPVVLLSPEGAAAPDGSVAEVVAKPPDAPLLLEVIQRQLERL